MARKDLVGFAVCYAAVFTMGNGLLPLMPIYAQLLGATREVAGYYIAFAFLCVSAGALLGGRISDTVRHPTFLLAGAGTLSVPATWLIGVAGNVAQLTLATGASWLLGGVCIGSVGAMAGKQAAENERGRIFGILGTMISVGSLLGGATFGRMVDAWGYARAIDAVAASLAVIPFCSLTLVSWHTAPAPKHTAPGSSSAAQWASPTFVLLILSEILAMTVAGSGNMGKSLFMNEKAFSSTAITATMAVGGLVSLPFPFVLGWISDKLGRRSVIVGSFAAGIVSLFLLTFSHALWQFVASTVLLAIHAISMSLGPALVAELVPQQRVGTGVSLFQGAAWVGTIAGYIYSGATFGRLGIASALLVGSILPAAAILLLLLARAPQRAGPWQRV